MKRTVTIEDRMPEIIETMCDEVREYLEEWLDENHDIDDGEPGLPSLCDSLDCDGRIHEIVDGNVPPYDRVIKDLMYMHGDEIEAVFDDAGFSRDDNWPQGWRAAAIYQTRPSGFW